MAFLFKKGVIRQDKDEMAEKASESKYSELSDDQLVYGMRWYIVDGYPYLMHIFHGSKTVAEMREMIGFRRIRVAPNSEVYNSENDLDKYSSKEE